MVGEKIETDPFLHPLSDSTDFTDFITMLATNNFDFSTFNAEGCVCDAGFYRNNDGVCVSKSNCGCYDESGLIMSAGDGHFEGSNFCKCQSGVIKCQMRKLVDDGNDDQVK